MKKKVKEENTKKKEVHPADANQLLKKKTQMISHENYGWI